jgi:hypothetical protein
MSILGVADGRFCFKCRIRAARASKYLNRFSGDAEVGTQSCSWSSKKTI